MTSPTLRSTSLRAGLLALAIAAPTPLRAADAPAGPRGLLPPLESLTATRERPLFRPDRRPLPPSAADEEPVAEQTGDAGAKPAFAPILLGVVIGEGRDLVVLAPEAGERIRRVRVGEEVDGWTLDRLEGRRAVFRRGEEEQSLVLRRAGTTVEDGESP